MIGKRRVWLLALAVVATSCSSDQADNTCDSDSDCEAPGTRCNVEARQCVCITDEACGDPALFCNAAGACQRRAGCRVNSDCPADTFCDVGSGACLAAAGEAQLGSSCGLSSHCPFGSICQGGVCTAGCYSDGDCPLGQICFEQRCVSGGPGEQVCSTSDFCEYGAICGPDNLCRDDRRGPYCRGCSRRSATNPRPCDDPRNLCIINSVELGGLTNVCGVDCSLGQPCPGGYDCRRIIVLTSDECGRTADCRCEANRISPGITACSVARPCEPSLPSGEPNPLAAACFVEGVAACNGGTPGGPIPCRVPRGQTEGNCLCGDDSDCAGGGTCVDGFCCTGQVRNDEALRCVFGETSVRGFCTCVTDDDCDRDVCDATSRTCLITGLPCTPGANDCAPIACVDGGCQVGQNCVPEQGLTCSIVNPR